MTIPGSRGITLWVAMVLLSGCGSGEREVPGSELDAEALRAEVLEVEDALNLAVDGLDCESGLASIRDVEPLFVSSGNVVRTKDRLLEQCKSMVAPRTGAVFSVDHRTANIVGDDAAVVVREGPYTISYKDGTSQEIYLVMTTVWSLESDGWKMVHLHESVRRMPVRRLDRVPGETDGPNSGFP